MCIAIYLLCVLFYSSCLRDLWSRRRHLGRCHHTRYHAIGQIQVSCAISVKFNHLGNICLLFTALLPEVAQSSPNVHRYTLLNWRSVFVWQIRKPVEKTIAKHADSLVIKDALFVRTGGGGNCRKQQRQKSASLTSDLFRYKVFPSSMIVG